MPNSKPKLIYGHNFADMQRTPRDSITLLRRGISRKRRGFHRNSNENIATGYWADFSGIRD